MELVRLNDKEYMRVVKGFLKKKGIPAKRNIISDIMQNIHIIDENESRTLYNTIIATSIYIALKASEYEMTMHEIADFFMIDKTTISKCYNRN